MIAVQVSPFEPSTDSYDQLARLWTTLHPDTPRFGSVWKTIDDRRPADRPFGRFVVWNGDELVGSAVFGDSSIAATPGQFELEMFARPQADGVDVLGPLYSEIERAMTAFNPRVLVAYVRDTQPWMVAFYEARGFETVQRTASSCLRVSRFDPAPFGALPARVYAGGYDLFSVRAYANQNGAWRRRYYELERMLLQDVPFLGGFGGESFETFEERVNDDQRFNLDSTFVALHRASGELVGLSHLVTFPKIPDYGFAGLTGTLRTHRRRGVATALKLFTIAYAAEHGIERVTALNEEHNPMWQLNRTLGFELEHMQLGMQKRVAT